jgi:hypothetical protein
MERPSAVPREDSAVLSTNATGNSKIVVAVDVDEVLAYFIPALARWHNRVHGSPSLSPASFFSYTFCEVWGGSNDEATAKVHAFFEAPEFLEQMEAVEGAFEVLRSRATRFEYVVVTSRQHCIRDATLSWLEKYFPGIFSDFRFGNHYGLDGAKRSKLDICRDIGAACLIDDSLKYARQCSAELESVVLFGDYAWNTERKGGQRDDATLFDRDGVACDALPTNVTRAVDWAAVGRALDALPENPRTARHEGTSSG